MRGVQSRIMTSSSISMSSTKAEIITSATELIEDLESKLSTEQQLHQNKSEERNAVLIILGLVTIYSLLF
tara:strand:+ start:990 stop:1199 length:210 start_codon:yes stop_codon:yes gene_type:complete